METILKASKHIMSVSKLHSIHVELQKFKGTTLIHAPHTCSSKHFVISMSLSINKARPTLLYCKRNSFAKNTLCTHWFSAWALFFVWDYYFCWPKSRWILRFNIYTINRGWWVWILQTTNWNLRVGIWKVDMLELRRWSSKSNQFQLLMLWLIIDDRSWLMAISFQPSSQTHNVKVFQSNPISSFNSPTSAF